MTYKDLENLGDKEICLFGAGVFGKTKGYDFVKAIGCQVDFYCDNKVAPGTVIRDEIVVWDIQYLYENKSNIQVFLTVGEEYRSQIIEQLQGHRIHNVIIVNWVTVSQLLDSIDASEDVTIQQKCRAIYNDLEYIKKYFNEKYFKELEGQKLNIDNPRTFNEKLQWLKLYNHRPEYTRMVDKYGLKQFVEEKIGYGYTIPVLGVWDSFEEIDFDKLPDRFVLKCTHDCGSIVIVDNKGCFDKEGARRQLSRALDINYFWIGREWPYKNVKRRIIAEPYLSDSCGEELKDYKFFCFNGKVKIIQVDFDRFTCHHRNIYSIDWEYIPVMIQYPTAPKRMIERPNCLKKMIEIAEKLSDSIPHVRIDFYIVNDMPVVGEMTFFHGSGMEKIVPAKWNEVLGDWIILPEKVE